MQVHLRSIKKDKTFFKKAFDTYNGIKKHGRFEFNEQQPSFMFQQKNL